jgi:hypothetical protein
MLDAIARHHSRERHCGRHRDSFSSRHRMDSDGASNAMVSLDAFGKQVNIKTNDFIDQDLYWANRGPTFNPRALIIIIHAEQRERLRQRTVLHRLPKYFGTTSPKFVGRVSNASNSK